MGEGEEKPFSVLHHLNLINYLVIVVPIATLIISYCVYFTEKEKLDYFPFLSEMALVQPAGRISNVGLSATSFIVMFVVYIREKEVSIIRRDITKMPERRYKATRRAMTISAYIFVISSILTTFFNYKYCKIPHIIFINFMYLSFVAYSFAGDMIFKLIGHPTKRFSRVLSMIEFTSILIFLALRYYVPNDSNDTLRLTSGNFFAVLSYIGLYTKLFVTKFDIPNCGIRISRGISIQ